MCAICLRNVQHLLEDLADILDTPSKRTLWFYIIPLLSSHHQRYCQRTLGLPDHVVKTGQYCTVVVKSCSVVVKTGQNSTTVVKTGQYCTAYCAHS